MADAFVAEMVTRLPLAQAVLQLFDYALEPALLQEVYDGNRGRCYTAGLTFPAFVGLLLTYPFATMAGGTLIYLACIPVSWSRYRHQLKAMPVAPVSGPNPGIDGDRVVGIRPTDKR